MKRTELALLYDAKSSDQKILYFDQLVKEVVCTDKHEVFKTIDHLEKLQKQGFHVVGCINFEAGYLFDEALSSYFINSEFPLLAFKVFKRIEQLTKSDLIERLALDQDNSFIHNFSLIDDYETYKKQFDQVQYALKHGETYQINLTSKYNFQFSGDPLAFYFKLIEQQSAAYTAFLDFGRWQVLSISPELFFKKSGSQVTCKPMKGTIKRHPDKSIDQQNKSFLANDIKNKTENVIIVDLLRNDLSHISQTGTVDVPKLFEIESFETVYQMTSTVKSIIDQSIGLKDILMRLFPCGSITGAPKVSTIKHIRQIETEIRNLYTGSIGYLKPNGDMVFNVAIRTLVIDSEKNSGELGVGGAITTSSDVKEEWEEIQLKANFVKQVEKPFDLIECILLEKGEYQYLDKHLSRLENSANTFNFNFDQFLILDHLMDGRTQLQDDASYKVKIKLQLNGQFDISYEQCHPFKKLIKLAISQEPIDSKNILFQHKTTANLTRGFYTQVVNDYKEKYNCDDVIFINEKGHITETSIFNLIVKLNDQLYTPKVSDGLLPGIKREVLLESGQIIEKSLTLDELAQADALYVINSIRGMVEAIDIRELLLNI
ncbi:aminodeoxychorismate synthase component I [Thiotrichales bacterium 19S9-12]|nr:aminodeoxychorismate synthase component I [Thiotrichales bacterium 19S9-11]MCF6812371.1 aminodeoxychorismate synthase component I [Thiotrichales bacterium 19S9-12]